MQGFRVFALIVLATFATQANADEEAGRRFQLKLALADEKPPAIPICIRFFSECPRPSKEAVDRSKADIPTPKLRPEKFWMIGG